MQALWMVLAAFLFASMGVCVKIASGFFNSAELVFYRGLIGIAILWLLARETRRSGRPATRLGVVWRFMFYGGLLAAGLQGALALIVASFLIPVIGAGFLITGCVLLAPSPDEPLAVTDP